MTQSPLARVLETLALVLVCIVVLFPILWMFMTAFKQARDAYAISLFFTPTLKNFVTVFSDPWNLGGLVLNSVIVAVGTMVLSVPAAALAAYSFSRFQLVARKFLFFIILAT